MDLDYNFYKKNFGSQFLKEKPGTAQTFPIDISRLDVDVSLPLKVVQVWNHMFEHDEDISAVIFRNQVLYQGKLGEYDDLVKRIKNNEYELGIDKNLKFYLIFEGELVE